MNTASLNAWQLTQSPWKIINYFLNKSCPLRKQRLQALPSLIHKRNAELEGDGLEVISMQEIWDAEAYQYIKNATVPSIFSHCIHHQGAGLMTCAKYPISNVTDSTFLVNGMPTHIAQADWFAEKGFTSCIVTKDKTEWLFVNLHTVSNKDRSGPVINVTDTDAVDRVSQAFQIARAIEKLKKVHKGPVIVLGDSNSETRSDVMQILHSKLTGLYDARAAFAHANISPQAFLQELKATGVSFDAKAALDFDQRNLITYKGWSSALTNTHFKQGISNVSDVELIKYSAEVSEQLDHALYSGAYPAALSLAFTEFQDYQVGRESVRMQVSDHYGLLIRWEYKPDSRFTDVVRARNGGPPAEIQWDDVIAKMDLGIKHKKELHRSFVYRVLSGLSWLPGLRSAGNALKENIDHTAQMSEWLKYRRDMQSSQ